MKLPFGLRKERDRDKGDENFKPDDQVRGIVNPLIDNRQIKFVGEGSLTEQILRDDRIDESEKHLVIEWARAQRALRSRGGEGKPDF